MRGPRWWWLLAILFAASVIQHHAGLFLFTLMLGFAALASVMWERFALAELSYTRHLGRTSLAFGEETDLSVVVYNAKPLPLPWVLINDQYPDGLTLVTGQLGVSRTASFKRALVNFLALRWYERVRRTYRVRGDRRGVYEFGPAEVYTGDLFGYRRQQMSIDHVDTLLVYPKVVPVEALGLPAGRPVGDAAYSRRIVEDPLRQAGVREYVQGDSIRHIHWKATARTQHLQTRVFDPSASHRLVIMVDVQTAHQPYSVVPQYLELIASAAASVAMDSLDKGYAVGLMANASAVHDRQLTAVPSGRHPEQARALLEALARLTNFRLTPFSRLLSNAAPILPYGATVVALTAQPDEQVQAALVRLQDAGHPVVLLTVGEEPAVNGMIERYHLGGVDAWERLEKLQLA
ncbi:MAG: DUF58 domain-containing protein [Anaerolineae bacterium]|nr:DUF58 domain-containing protein [Anaerolineae bacterium]